MNEEYTLTLGDENQHSLIGSPLEEKQILVMLQRTPKSHVFTRPAKGGGTWEFVTGTYVKKVLNYVFGFMWDFNIIDKGREGDTLWVQGRLIVKTKDGSTITKEQFGRVDIKKKKDGTGYLDYGNDLKSATTDALKKCASELGIASDIYGKEEFKEIKAELKKSIVKNAVIADDEKINNKLDEATK